MWLNANGWVYLWLATDGSTLSRYGWAFDGEDAPEYEQVGGVIQAIGELYVMDGWWGGTPFMGMATGVKLWSRLLDPLEVEAERYSRAAVDRTNLAGEWLLDTVETGQYQLDTSGNGAHLYNRGTTGFYVDDSPAAFDGPATPSQLGYLPDVEALAIRHLDDAGILAGSFHGAFPDGPTYPVGTVVRIGGRPPLPRWLDTATLQVDVWADTKAEAFDGAATALASLVAMEGVIDTGVVQGVVTGVEVYQGLRWFPDPITEKPRYSCTVAVTAHPN